MVQQLVGRNVIQPPWVIPSGLRQLCAQVAPVFESAEQILEKHTCLPAYLPFAAPDSRPALLAHVFDGQRHPGIAAYIGLTGKAIIAKPRMALCPVCVREDLLQNRPLVWRRQHQLGLGVCSIHGTDLVAGCGRCSYSQIHSRSPRLPQRDCWCGQPHTTAQPAVTVETRRVLTRMAGYATELLGGALVTRSPEEIGAYFHLCAQREGYANGSRVKTPELIAQLRRKYSDEVLRRLNAVIPEGQNWVSISIGRKVAPNVLGRNLLLFDMFGERIPTARDFHDSQAHIAALDSQRAQRPVSTPTDARRHTNRQILGDFRARHPEARRSAAIAAHPGAVVWAREHDAEWYAELFPPAPRGSKAESGDDRQQYLTALDRRTVAHCRDRQAALLAGKGQPKQITKATLLKGCVRGNQVTRKLLQDLPLTRAFLATAVERREAFRRRYALWILEQPELPGSDRLAAAARKTGLRIDEIDELNFSLINKEKY
jgi:hypothetical protein